MGEYSRHLGSGVICGYCGDHKVGAEVRKLQAISLSDMGYLDDTEIPIDPSRDIKDQVWEFLKDRLPESYDAVQCPMCEAITPADYDDIVDAELWECTECNGAHESEKDAEICCDYQRRRLVEQANYTRDRIEEARRLLERNGYQVGGAPQPQRPVSSTNSTLQNVTYNPYGL